MYEREIFSGQKSIFKREIVSKETSFQERKNLDGFFSRQKQTVSREKRCLFKREQYFQEVKIFSSGKNIFKREKKILHTFQPPVKTTRASPMLHRSTFKNDNYKQKDDDNANDNKAIKKTMPITIRQSERQCE